MIEKKYGKFYTPVDLTNFMISEMLKLDNSNTNKSIIDPTCGNGEFLISYLLNHININKSIDENDLIQLVKNINGNDISEYSILISKIRIFMLVSYYLKDCKNINKCYEYLNSNFSSFNATNSFLNNKKYDYVLGNPPYLESSKCEFELEDNLSNIYANVLKNSINSLNENGILSFVIPMSYVCTIRMKKIRKFIEENCNVEILYNFGDRPSSLFILVHQKITVIICRKKSKFKKHNIYTSKYNCWYKNEREHLFNNISNFKTDLRNEEFIHKINSNTEVDIYKKIESNNIENSLFCYLNANNDNVKKYN